MKQNSKNNLNSYFSDVPKLLNGYGQLFDYKDNDQANLAMEKIHQKRLNLEREIRKFKIEKKVAKTNFIKFKANLKASQKSKLESNYLQYLSQKKELKLIYKHVKRLIPLQLFFKQKIKLLKSEIKNNIKLTKKSIKLISYNEDLNDAKIKVDKFYHAAIKTEDLLNLKIALINFSEDYINWNSDKDNFKNDFDLVIKEIVHKFVLNLKNNNDFESEYKFLSDDELINLFTNDFKSIITAYKDQYYFKYKHNLNSLQTIEQLKQNFVNEKKAIKNNYLKLLKDEKNKINNAYQNNVKLAQKQFAFENNQIKLQQLNNEKKILQNELKNKYNEKQNLIKKIKKEEHDLYKKNKKMYKSKNKFIFVFYSSKKQAIEKASNQFHLRLLLDYRLWSLNNWERKINLNEIKANYMINLGNKLDELTYDGSYLIKNGNALKLFNKNLKINNENLLNQLKNKELFHFFSRLSSNDKLIFKNKKAEVKSKFLTSKNELLKKYKNKAISKVAFKNEKLKLQIFYEEDLKWIKMNLASVKDKYIINDHIIKYKKQNYLINKELEQEQNIITKEVPIEYKKNNSIWMTFLAFIFPGVNELILKNYKKAIFFILMSLLVWAIFIPYSFGVFNIKGNGIIGLVRLSWEIEYSEVYGSLFSDARYALVEGVIALMLLIFSFAYFSISAIWCFKITRAMEKGIRYNTWFETKKILKSVGFPYAISIPGLILIIFIVLTPIIVSLLLAFTNIGTKHNPAAGQETNWVGFNQFITIFSNPNFFQPLGHVLWWNIVWAVGTTLLVLFIGTVMALCIENRNIKAKAVWRTIFILPWAIPAFISILFFKVMFTPESTGFVNSLLINSNIIDQPINWTNDAILARLLLILIQTWLGHSYIVLLVSGNIKSIPNDIYEAATVEGASPFKQFIKLTLPIILIQIAPLLIGQFTFNFNNFSLIWLFNDGGSKIDPTYIYDVGNNDILLSWIFKMTFGAQASVIESNQSIASALVIIMSIFIVAASGIGFARSKAFRKSEDI